MQGHESFTSSSSSSDSQHHTKFHFNMNDFFQHFDSASSNFHHADHNHFGFHFDSLFDDDDESEEYETDEFAEGNYFDFSDLFGASDDIYMQQSTSSRQNCRTITTRQGNTVSTITECF